MSDNEIRPSVEVPKIVAVAGLPFDLADASIIITRREQMTLALRDVSQEDKPNG